MKKRSIKSLSLGKTTISTLKRNLFGGAPTTNQSQQCPEPIQIPTKFPLPMPISQDPSTCTIWTHTNNQLC
jgi:hypothetical protein